MRRRLTHSLKSKRAQYILGSLAVLLIALIMVGIFTKDDTKQPREAAEQRVANVAITKNGFDPAAVVVSKGTKIIWTNMTSGPHQVTSNPHPAHDGLPGLESKYLYNADSYEFTANTAGVFGYHDEADPSVNGTIQVKD